MAPAQVARASTNTDSIKGLAAITAMGVPLTTSFAKNEEDRQVLELVYSQAVMGRPYVVGPGVPAERLAALRTAFQNMLKDPEFLAACEKRNVTIEPATGEEMDAITRETVQMPKPIVAALAKLLKE